MTEPAVGVVWSDFGGVLTPPISEAADRLATASGVPWPELAAAAEQVAARHGLRGLGQLELGLVSQRDWAGQLTPYLTSTPRIDLGHWDRYWYADRPLSQPLADELRRIADTGVPVGLLTNSVAEWEPHRARMLAGRDLFTATVKSHELQLAKPDPAIFAYADSVLPPPGGRRALLIDDSATNCRAAEHHGWLAIHHRTVDDTVARLGRLRFTGREAGHPW